MSRAALRHVTHAAGPSRTAAFPRDDFNKFRAWMGVKAFYSELVSATRSPPVRAEQSQRPWRIQGIGRSGQSEGVLEFGAIVYAPLFDSLITYHVLLM